MRLFWLLSCWLPVVSGLQAQPYPQDYFRSPLTIPLIMSGTYGELRHNHFHAGVDFKTQGREGLPIIASASGYVSRVKVSPRGYGLAVYIDHPNGYTTVYGHLQSFYPALAQYIEALQYTLQSYAVDVYPEPGTFPIAAGQQIGLSGNSGGSAGPHLHFEIRDTESEVPLHPLLFGFDVADAQPPVLHTLYVYEQPVGNILPVSKQMQLQPLSSRITKAGTNTQQYAIRHGTDTLLVTSKRVAFGVYTFDRADEANNKNGIYSLRLAVNDQLHYGFTMDAIPFDEHKYINSHMDYCYQRQSRRRIHKCYRSPGNFLSIYDTTNNDGWLTLAEGNATKITLLTADPMGNTGITHFWVKYTGTPANARLGKGDYWNPQITHMYTDSLFSATLPAWSLYDTLQVNVVQESIAPLVYSVGVECEPLHYGIDIAMRSTLPAPQREKAVLLVEWEGTTIYRRAYWKDDWLHGHSPYFGRFSVGVDTTAPTVRMQGMLRPGKRIAFTIRDAGIGIADYAAFIGEEWVLLAYDAKRDLLTGQLPASLDGDEQLFTLRVSDYCGNTYTFTQNIKAIKP